MGSGGAGRSGPRYGSGSLTKEDGYLEKRIKWTKRPDVADIGKALERYGLRQSNVGNCGYLDFSGTIGPSKRPYDIHARIYDKQKPPIEIMLYMDEFSLAGHRELKKVKAKMDRSVQEIGEKVEGAIKKRTGVSVKMDVPDDFKITVPHMSIFGDDVDAMMKDVRRLAKGLRGTQYEPLVVTL